jgi:NAD(P)-dependent dehydrogenase (short-subunit alcohol dehydrogenase family)
MSLSAASARHSALDLSDQCIAITGGSGALGQAITATLQSHGARVVVLDIAPHAPHIAPDAAPTAAPAAASNATPNTEGTDEPSEPSGIPPRHSVLHLVADVADETDVDRALDEIEKACGVLPSTLLCHAGEVGTHPLVDYPLDEFDRLVRTNLRGAYVPARQLSRRWLEGGLPGHLVFTTSWVHQVSWPEIGPYSASKAALVQLTRSFARELAPHAIRANAIAPGIVGAGMAKQQWDTDDDYRRRASRAVPLGSLQTPQSMD